MGFGVGVSRGLGVTVAVGKGVCVGVANGVGVGVGTAVATGDVAGGGEDSSIGVEGAGVAASAGVWV